jgi:Tfp pilus assembly protein PilF
MEHTRISHYEIGRRLGRGGMGEVYEAVDLDLDRRVALKFIAPEMAADAEALKRFEREARAAAALNHPHIATLFAFERDGERTFIAMELVGGESVRDRIRPGRDPLPVAEALGITRDIAGALALAHRRGIVHRDVKPENVMFDEDGVVKLMDFGLARAAQASRMTMTGSTLGTAAYMPPESVRGGAGAPGDVFALGVMLHEMLCGELPFAGDSPLALLYTIANEEPKPLRDARPDAPEAVAELVARMLKKDPDERPDAATVGRELAALTHTAVPIGAGDTVELEVSRVPTRPTAPAPGEALVPAAPVALEAPSGRQRRAGWPVVIGGLIVVSLGGVGFIAWQATRGPGVEQRRQEAVRLTNAGFDLLQERELDAAQARFDSALVMDPHNGRATLDLAQVHSLRGDDARAVGLLRDLLARKDTEPLVRAGAYGMLGGLDLNAQAWDGAIDNLQKSFEIDSSTARAYNDLAYALIRAGRQTEAVDLLTRALPRFPGQPALHKNLALAELTTGDARSAVHEADQALAIQPTYAAAMGVRARAKARLNDAPGARADWQRFLALGPSRADSSDVATELLSSGVLR